MQNGLNSLIDNNSGQPQILFNALLVGESCLDIYRFGSCNRISPEAPVPIMNFEKEEVSHGMAAYVARLMKTFNVSSLFATNDYNTIRKVRYIDSGSKNQLMREDTEKPIATFNLDEAISNIDYFDVVLISDYDKGLIDHRQAMRLCSVANRNGIPVFVDTKRRNISCYHHAIVKVNELEYSNLIDNHGLSKLIVTSGNGGARCGDIVVKAPDVNVVDVTGAGDVFLATLAYSYVITDGNFEKSITNAVNMASRSVGHFGTYNITKEDISEICH